MLYLHKGGNYLKPEIIINIWNLSFSLIVTWYFVFIIHIVIPMQVFSPGCLQNTVLLVISPRNFKKIIDSVIRF